MSDYIDSAAISDIASKDTNRLVGNIAKALAANSVFINVIKGGVWKNGISDTVRVATQEQALPGDSLAVPTFAADLTYPQSGTPSTEGVATTEYSYSLESKRGRGPKVSVKQGKAAFKDSYIRAEDSLTKLVVQYVNADIRAQMYLRSGSKFSCVNGQNFDTLFTGGTGEISVDFTNVAAPNSALKFKTLHTIARFMNEVLFAEQFEGGPAGGAHYKFIAGGDAIEALREDVGVENKLIAFTQGGFKFGETTLKAFQFEESPAYRGISFGIDHRPLRANALDADGQPVLLNPVVGVATTKGTAARPNPDWLTAEYEIGFLVAPGAFERQVPEQYVGEGSFKFAPQLVMGELKWHHVVDNGTNEWADFGYHKYQISRAYRPLRPEFIVPIMYKRPLVDLGLVTI